MNFSGSGNLIWSGRYVVVQQKNKSPKSLNFWEVEAFGSWPVGNIKEPCRKDKGWPMAIGVRQPYLKGPYSAAWPVPCKCRWLGLSSGRQFVRICESVEWSQWVVIHDFHLFLVVSHVFWGDFHGFLQFVMVSIAYLESTNGLTGVGSGDTIMSEKWPYPPIFQDVIFYCRVELYYFF